MTTFPTTFIPSHSPGTSSQISLRSLQLPPSAATAASRKVSLGESDQQTSYFTRQNLDHHPKKVGGYARRQLSIEAVQCVHVEQGSSSDTLYTFLVKPLLLQNSRSNSTPLSRKQMKQRSTGASEEILFLRGDEEERTSQQQELEPFHVQKNVKQILELSNRLLTSFEILLDPRRGGPQPLTKEMLSSKWNVKDMFKRKKRQSSGTFGTTSTTVVSTDLYKLDSNASNKMELVNEFFLKVIQVGGEVLASSRAMQDFL
jgi:hypothetical protein